MGMYVYSKETRPEINSAHNTDLNANQMKLVPFELETSSLKVKNTAVNDTTAQTTPLPPTPSAPPVAVAQTPSAPPVCMEWQHVVRNDLDEAKAVLTKLVKPENIIEKTKEEPSRFWIYIPSGNDAKAIVAKLKAAGITDVSVEPSHNISLGVYSVEATAKRHLEEIRNKGFKEAKLEARKMQVKEVTFLLKDVDKAGQDSLNTSLDKFSRSKLRVIDCSTLEKK